MFLARDTSASGSFDWRLAQRGLVLAERAGHLGRLCFTLAELAVMSIVTGDWAAARSYAERGVALGQAASGSFEGAPPLFALGWLEAWEGNWQAAKIHLEETLSKALQVGGGGWDEGAACWIADIEIEEGKPDRAVKRLEALMKDGRQLVEPAFLATLARACFESGGDVELRRSEVLTSQAIGVARDLAFTEALPLCLWVRGIVLMRKGDVDSAKTVLEEGLQISRTLPYPYYEACVLAQLGILYGQIGDGRGADHHLHEALTIFRRLGARKKVEQVDSLLTGLRADVHDSPALKS